MKIQLILLSAFAFVNSCIGQIQLNYQAFLQSVVKNNQIIKTAANQTFIAKHQLVAAKGGFDPVLNSETERKDVFQNYYVQSANELKWPIFAGHSLKTGYVYGQGPFINASDKTSTRGMTYLGIQSNLLQGLLIDKNRADLLKAHQYVAYFNAEKAILENELLFKASMSYADLLYHNTLKSLYQSYQEIAMKRHKAIVSLVDLGEKANVDSIETYIQFQSRVIDRQATQIDFSKQLFDVIAYMQTPQLFSLPLVVSEELDSLYDISSKSVLATNYSPAVNPIIQQAQSKQSLLQVDVRLKKEMLKPKLEVSYQFLSSNAWQSSLFFDMNQYKLGAKMSFPLLFRKPYNEYKLSKFVAENNQFDLDVKAIQLTAKANFVVSNFESMLSQVNDAQRLNELNKQLLLAEQTKFEHGESSLFLVNIRESRCLESEVKLLNLKTKLIKSHFEYKYLNAEFVQN